MSFFNFMEKNVITVLNTVYLGNPVRIWLGAALVFLALLLVLKLIKSLVFRKFNRLTAETDTKWDDLFPHLVKRINIFVLMVVSLYAGTMLLALPENILLVIKKTTMLIVLVQIAVLGSFSIKFWQKVYQQEHITNNAATVTIFSAVAFILQVLLWSIALLLALANLGVNITALVTGLGVGGIAVALAVQNILGDLFASFSIILDKPFVVGDFIIVDDYLGTIEKIGLKTTRIRSLSGEQLIFSNTDLLKSRIRNYKRMYERRVVFGLGVIYQTTYDQLAAIPDMLREIVESQDGIRFDRAHFKQYGAYSLDFEIVYYVLSPDYNIYMDIQQAINLEIFRRFGEAGIEFAYPTRTLYVEPV